MKIKRLTVSIEPHYVDGLVWMKWKILDSINKEIGYDQTLGAEEIIGANDFRSIFDHLWEKAKYLIEKEAFK